MKKLTHGSLFSGIGGFEIAAEWANYQNIFSCELDKKLQKFLHERYKTETYGDIKGTDFTPHRGEIDVVSGGFPCQDISVAGGGAGIKHGARCGLFFEYIRAVREIAPRIAIFENVPGVRKYRIVREEFEKAGYRLAQFNVEARWFGFPHKRERVYGVAADVNRIGLQEFWNFEDCCSQVIKSQREVSSHNNPLSDAWTSEYSKFVQLDDGISGKSSAIKAYGNAVVPIIPFMFFEILKETLLKDD